MHMVSKRDLDSAELETMRTSMSPTMVMTNNGEVQTTIEATVYVKELDLFVTVIVLSLGKLCEDHGYTYHMTSGQKPHLTKNGKRIDCNKSNYVPFVVPGLSTLSVLRMFVVGLALSVCWLSRLLFKVLCTGQLMGSIWVQEEVSHIEMTILCELWAGDVGFGTGCAL